ncbi:MAG TPA: SRPBCC domain-containing protein [Acidimicrobiales bacterium]|nr:SRPBCC domain-containing protein [Acidimicrobiales bacterium]
MPEQTTGDALVIERVVDAPTADVWSMWTDPERFALWYGPAGATIGTVRFDLRPGGERVVSMTAPTPGGERTMWFSGEHVEIDAPGLLVYTEAMGDAHGGSPQSPVTTVRLELAAEDGRTRLRLTHHGIPADSPGATGWQMALDKLQAALGGS